MSAVALPGQARRVPRPPRILVNVLVSCLVVAGSSWGMCRTILDASFYYFGDTRLGANYHRFRNGTLALAERAVWIQRGAGSGITYGWADGGQARYIRTASGTYPIYALWSGPHWPGRQAVAGYVENGTGAVVLAISGERPGACLGLARSMSLYAQAVGSYAWLPGPGEPALPERADVDAAAWHPIDERMAGCLGKDKGALLFRFDRLPAAGGRS